MTFGCWMRAWTRSVPPAGGWKSERCVSMRPEVQRPAPSRCGVMRRLPAPSSDTLAVLSVMVSTSPVPKFAGPPGYEVPVVYRQFPVLTRLPAAPLKSSRKTWLHPAGGGGAAASAAAATPSAASRRAAAARTGVVELDDPALAQRRCELTSLGGQLWVARQREHGHLDRRQPRVEAQDGTPVHAALRVRRLVLVVRLQQEREHRTGQAGGRLDDVGNPTLALVLVEVRQVDAGVLAVGREVEVGAVGDALQLGELRAAEAEAVLDIDRALRVVRQLLSRVLEVAQVRRGDAQVGVPVPALGQPVLVPLLVGAGLDEVLHLHLLELARTEDEVARRDLVAEALAHLGDAERRLLARRGHHVGEVDEDSLCRLRAQVVQALVVLDGAEIGLHQAVEHPGLGEAALAAAVRAVDLGQANRRRRAVLLGVGLLKLVGPEPLVAGLALGQRVDERVHVARGHPHLAGEDHGRVQADDVVALLDHGLPPLPAYILLQLHAQGSVVPGRPGAAVNLTRRVHEAAALGQAHHGIDTV